MKTTGKPISFLYYGTEQALKMGLEPWRDRIEWCHWIFHKGEIKEKRVRLSKASHTPSKVGKNHIHAVIQFKGRTPVEILQGMFPNDEDGRSLVREGKPCLSLNDWLIYCTHRDEYIVELKRLPPKPTKYGWDKFASTDYDALEQAANDAEEWLDLQLAAIRRREEVQVMAADISRSWPQVLALCRNANEEMVAWRMRDAILRERKLSRDIQEEFKNETDKAVAVRRAVRSLKGEDY